MFMVPTSIFSFWLLGFWSLGLVAGAAYLLHEWYERSRDFDPARNTYLFHPALGGNADTAFLIGGLALLLFAVAGGLLMRLLLRVFLRSFPEAQADALAPPGADGTAQRLRRADGSEIQVESHGPENGFPLVLTHGWGTNRREWEYLRRELSGSEYRLITWDLPGLGDSEERVDKDYRLENFAHDLDLVLRETCENRPALLIGHSIGGMTIQTFCRLSPQALGTRVAGLILVHTTYTNPVRTAKGAALYTALEKPLLVPLLYLTIAFSPLLRILGWMSYQNGSAHLNCLLSAFAGTQSVEQLEFFTRFGLQSPPAVIARGMLGMLHYDATETLKTIPIPTLVISGDRDISCRPEASERISQDIPHAQLTVLSPANHLGLLEHRVTFAQSIRTFAAFVSSSLPTPNRPAGTSSTEPVKIR